MTNAAALLFSLLIVSIAAEDVLNGPLDSTVVTADRGPDPIPEIDNSGNTQTQLVNFDDLPPQIQQQVVDMIQKQQEQTKLGQQEVQDQMNVEQQVQQQTQQVQPVVAGDAQVPASPETHTVLLALPEELIQQEMLEEEAKKSAAEQAKEKPLTIVLQQENEGDPIGHYVVDTDQLPPEVRDQLLKQVYLEGGQPILPEQMIPQQQLAGPASQSDEQLANGVAELLTRMAMTDPQGQQGIDLEDIPAEIRSEVVEFLLRTQQLDQVTQEQLKQHSRPSSVASTADKHHPEGLETVGQIGGGILGGLIAGAVGGGYPGAGYQGYPGGNYQRPPGGSYGGGYPGGGYPGGGYPGGGYPGGGYPGGGYPGGYPSSGYPGGYPGAGYPYPGGSGGSYPGAGGYPSSYPGAGYPQQVGGAGGGYPSQGAYGPASAGPYPQRPQRPKQPIPGVFYEKPRPSSMYHTQQPAVAVLVSRDQLIGGFPSSSFSSGFPYGSAGPIVAYMARPSSNYYQQKQTAYHRPVKPIAAIDLSSGQTVGFLPQTSADFLKPKVATKQHGSSMVYLNPDSYYY